MLDPNKEYKLVLLSGPGSDINLRDYKCPICFNNLSELVSWERKSGMGTHFDMYIVWIDYNNPECPGYPFIAHTGYCQEVYECYDYEILD